MSLAQSLNPQKKSRHELLKLAADIAAKLRSVSGVKRIVLFGSAAEDRFRVGSDLDFLLIFGSLDELKEGRNGIRGLGLLHSDIPIDLVFVTEDRFNAKKDIGGVCFVAHKDGVEL